MMLRGAANTARLIIAHIQPTSATLLGPFAKVSETTVTIPSPPMLNIDINFIVDI